MKRIVIFTSFLAFIFVGLLQISALSQGDAYEQAERFHRSLGYSPTTNDIEQQANAFWYAYRQGFNQESYDPSNEYVLDLIYVGVTQDEIDFEIDLLTNLYNLGLAKAEVNTFGDILSPQIQELISSSAISAYADGYAQGLANATGTSVNAVTAFIPQMLGVTFAFFFQVLSFQVFGVSALTILGTLLALSIGILTFKLFFGR